MTGESICGYIGVVPVPALADKVGMKYPVTSCDIYIYIYVAIYVYIIVMRIVKCVSWMPGLVFWVSKLVFGCLEVYLDVTCT